MPTTIAVAGKGGTGKTTVSALLIDHLARLGIGTILAVDADPSTNLNLALGVEVEQTIGGEREEFMEEVQSGRFSPGLDKQQYFQLKLHECLVETEHFDLLAMGRPEGPGCYCAPNHILRRSMDALAGGYDFVVMDNEAGLEHLSRRTTRDVELLLVISDPTVRGLIAARRVFDLVAELGSRVNLARLLVNRVPPGADGQLQLAPELTAKVEELQLPLLGLLPLDPHVADLDAAGQPLVRLPQDAPIRRQLVNLVSQVLPVLAPLAAQAAAGS